MQKLEERIETLKRIIVDNDGRNVATSAFRREVDEMIGQFYDDIGRIRLIPANAIFELFLIKTLYVTRGSHDAAILEYLSELLTNHLHAREPFPLERNQRPQPMSFSHALAEGEPALALPQLFEAYRMFADNALFISGVLPHYLRRARRRADTLDEGYYVTWGKTYYQKAAEQERAEAENLRETLLKLSRYFEVYMDALNEASETFIMGLDMSVIANRMLDAFNRYQETGDEAEMDNARKFAALLQVDSQKFPALFTQRRRTALARKSG